MTTPAKLPLSVAIITQNEEERLPACLNSVAFADDIVVVDSGSSDDTVAIAKQAGARVFVEPWRGFGPQKQFAIDQCRHDWVLVLDADERIPPETATAIASAMADDQNHAAFSFPRKNFFMGRWIRHGGWWPDRIVRLIRKESCRYLPQMVHETMEVQGSTGVLHAPFEHHTNRDLAHTMAKMNHYSSASARELLEKGAPAHPLNGISKALWSFFFNYFFRLGILDGYPGMVIAVMDATIIFFKYAKLVEFQQGAGSDLLRPSNSSDGAQIS